MSSLNGSHDLHATRAALETELARIREQIAFFDEVELQSHEVMQRLLAVAQRSVEVRERTGREIVTAVERCMTLLATMPGAPASAEPDLAADVERLRAATIQIAHAIDDLDDRLRKA